MTPERKLPQPVVDGPEEAQPRDKEPRREAEGTVRVLLDDFLYPEPPHESER